MLMTNILHITTHMGGGVGKTLSNIAVYAKLKFDEFQHSIVCLESPEKFQFTDFAKENDVPIYLAPSNEEIYALMEKSDIVQIEWWHHPLMAQWLETFPFPEIRLIIWSHISGHYAPIIPEAILKIPDVFLFTTPFTFESPYFKNINLNTIGTKIGVVFGSGGFDNILTTKKENHDGFNVGYVGTLDFCKLHPDFIQLCAEVQITEARFIMVGDASTRCELEKDASALGILNNFEFVGYTNNVAKEYARFDIFGYPLNPEHFGASENALLEAMAAAVPPVVMFQSAEKYIVKNMETGLLVNNAIEYGEAVRYLYTHPKIRMRLGNNAKKYVIDEYSVENIVKKLDTYYEALNHCKKKRVLFKGGFGHTPAEWFLSCLGKDRFIFERSMQSPEILTGQERVEVENDIRNCRQILRGKTKSSINHFLNYFPEDAWLNYWANLITE